MMKVRIQCANTGANDWSLQVVSTKNNKVVLEAWYSNKRKAIEAGERLLKGFGGQKKVEVVG